MRENISGLDVFEERWKVALEAKYVVYEFSEQMVINLERTYAQSYICERICLCVRVWFCAPSNSCFNWKMWIVQLGYLGYEHHTWIYDTNNPKTNASKYHGTYLQFQIQRYFATFLFLKFFCERRLSERDHEKNIFPFPHKRYITFISSVKKPWKLMWVLFNNFFKKELFPQGNSNSR